MRLDHPLPPWPPWRATWWVVLLGLAGVVLFAVAFVTDVRCGLGRCAGGPTDRLLSLDGLTGLPRWATTGVFVACAGMAWRGARRGVRDARRWWSVAALVCLLLAAAKLTSVHSLAKEHAAGVTLAVGSVATAVFLVVLRSTGRRAGVRGAGPVAGALAVYALAALGLDAVTGLVADLQGQTGLFTATAATYVEEFGEYLGALVVLVTVRWKLPVAVPHLVGDDEGVGLTTG